MVNSREVEAGKQLLIASVVLIAFVIGLIILFSYSPFTPINFCPDACDACVDKVIMTPQDNISACQPVWNQMSSGVAPEFTGLLEQDICEVDYTHQYKTNFSAHSIGECAKFEWKKDYDISPETYLYTYQIQNAVQFDYCVQEYYKQHFGGDE